MPLSEVFDRKQDANQTNVGGKKGLASVRAACSSTALPLADEAASNCGAHMELVQIISESYHYETGTSILTD